VKHLAATFAVLLVAGCQPAVVDKGRIETRLPDGLWPPKFVDIEGRELRPLADAGTRALALIFVIQDCPISNSYIPALNRLHESYAPRGIQLLIVQSDPELTAEDARTHARQYEVGPPVVFDREHVWVRRAGATRTPEAAIFSRDGRLQYLGRIDDRYAALGKSRQQATTHDLQDALEAVLADQPVPKPWGEAVGCNIPDLPKAE
jgi:hypothetical protein